jgi:hypothetical protein
MFAAKALKPGCDDSEKLTFEEVSFSFVLALKKY